MCLKHKRKDGTAMSYHDPRGTPENHLKSALERFEVPKREKAIEAALAEIAAEERRRALKDKFEGLPTDEMERLLGGRHD
jgi:hypothetical protein